MTIPAYIFGENVPRPAIEFKLPEADERLSSTPQLAYCLELLKIHSSADKHLEPTVLKWLQQTEKDTDEQERLHTMATEVIRAFKRDEIKDAKVVAEVVSLVPILDKDAFQNLLREFYSGMDHCRLLDFYQLEGLAQLIQGAETGYLSSDDLVKILELLNNRLKDTHQQSTQHMHELTLAVSNVLDAMADTNVTDLKRETLHEPLSRYLGELEKSSDPYLVYQAAYAYQALQCVPDNETKWQAARRRTGKVAKGVSGLISATKGFDINKFIESLVEIQEGFEASKIVHKLNSAYKDVSQLVESGKGLLESLKEGFSFDCKREWYAALRAADVLIRDGEFATFKELVWKAPCRCDPAFQWGVCQRLGEVASNPLWDSHTRRDAIAFLAEMYKNDEAWKQQTSVKQWTLNILKQLSSTSGDGPQFHTEFAMMKLQELGANGDVKNRGLYKGCQETGIIYPLKVTLPQLGLSSLLDRVQNRPDVEGNIRLMRKQRTQGRGGAIYISPQAKLSLQSSDDSRFSLMEKVKEFLDSDQKVFLLLGDSGAGKSTFSRELEFHLWKSYKKSGRIPLYISLPAIDKPEHDMIAKQLRRANFSEAQIREMKLYREFILICDGYDESQQTHNLYMSNRLNQPGEWDAQMVISCRTEYLGTDYRERFQPGDRNHVSDPSLFQEAVVAPFSIDQIQSYIQQYVTLHRPPWQAEDYNQALEHIPTLKDLVTNPFLMTLSLEVLPRMVDPGQDISSAHITRVGLYDHFIEQWLERGKKRLGEKDLTPQARAAFESLTDEGFARNGIAFLKHFAEAIYKEQGGHPIVEYSRLMDGKSWKAEFFDHDSMKLLREACPLVRNGNQHRFIHRSLLEYGLARAVFDPQDRRKRITSNISVGRPESLGSKLSIETQDCFGQMADAIEQEPDIDSPLVWRTIVKDHSLLQFLAERAQQQPVFKQQLLAYIEHSKKDKKWRKAAANAITILVRAGVQFNSADLKGIQIPRADLSYGTFDSAQLRDADLRKVNLRGVWMRQTDLSRAQMTGARFGELPFLTEECQANSCAYSPDGKSFAVGLEDGNINVYATSNWERIGTLSGHTSYICSVSYSPKGNQIASAGRDRTIRLWDSKLGSLIYTLSGHDRLVSRVAYSPRGCQVASASGDRTVRLWDATTGDCVRTLHGHDRAVLGVAYSPKGLEIASCGVDLTIRLWNAMTGECIRILSGHTDWVQSVAYSPQGDQLASSSRDMNVRLWDVETGVCRHVLTGHSGDVNNIAYSPNGDQIASASMDSTVRVWEAETGICRQTLTGHTTGVADIVFALDGNQIATCSADKTVRLSDVSVEASRSAMSGHSSTVCCIKCSPEGDLVASCSVDQTIRLWDSKTGESRRILSGHSDSVFSIAFSPQGDWIVSGSADRSVRIWKVKTGTCFSTLTGHGDAVQGVAYSPHGDVVASAGDDMTVRLWDLSTGECQITLNGHTGGVRSVTYSPDGNRIASGSKDSTIRIWDAVTRECLQILVGHTNWVRDVVYSHQGHELASAGYDKIIRLWDVESGESRGTLTGHNDKVTFVTYSPQDDLIASGSWDKTVRLWDVATKQSRAEIGNLVGPVVGVAWNGDDDLVISGGNGSVLKWKVTQQGDCRVHLLWSATNGTLTMAGASVHGVHGLSAINKGLLKQRGAVGEPETLLRDASKKVVVMTSVVSKLKESSGTGTALPSIASTLSEQYGQIGKIDHPPRQYCWHCGAT
ncbi:MAG: WD40-repeat-containing domain protein [Benniella sp.]|nr:MAG: WD40-repeat-containing domain protein [Benniella sp.]